MRSKQVMFKGAKIDMKTRFLQATLFACVVLGAAVSHASTVTFDFNSLASNATGPQIQTYMNSVLGTAGSVAVTGAVGANGYTGDGHVVGSTTLAATGGTFIINGSGSNDILMTFSGVKIYRVSFDLEIFPDGTCPILNSANCGGSGNPNQPDFKFDANGLLIQTWLAQTPTSPNNHSPASGSTNAELAPQLLITTPVTFNFPSGVTTLEFDDWPATIGIDNLQITTTVPEPTGIVLMVSSFLASLPFLRRRMSKYQ